MRDKLEVTARLVPPVEPDVVLTLPLDVARTLYDLTENIGGDPRKTYRAHSNLIGDALREVLPHTELNNRFDGTVHAEDLPR